MKLFFISLILVLNLQSWTNADEISDFQIEGMSIGDSALEYFSQNQIKNGKIAVYNDNTYTTIEPSNPKTSTYDYVSFSYRTDDAKYLIEAVTGIKSFKNDFQKCYDLQDIIFKEIQNIFPTAEVNDPVINNLSGNRKGTTRQTYVELIDGSFAAVQCYNYEEIFSKSRPVKSLMRVNLFSKIYNDWLINKAFK